MAVAFCSVAFSAGLCFELLRRRQLVGGMRESQVYQYLSMGLLADRPARLRPDRIRCRARVVVVACDRRSARPSKEGARAAVLPIGRKLGMLGCRGR